jgi:hypothetical protein
MPVLAAAGHRASSCSGLRPCGVSVPGPDPRGGLERSTATGTLTTHCRYPRERAPPGLPTMLLGSRSRKSHAQKVTGDALSAGVRFRLGGSAGPNLQPQRESWAR